METGIRKLTNASKKIEEENEILYVKILPASVYLHLRRHRCYGYRAIRRFSFSRSWHGHSLTRTSNCAAKIMQRQHHRTSKQASERANERSRLSVQAALSTGPVFPLVPSCAMSLASHRSGSFLLLESHGGRERDFCLLNLLQIDITLVALLASRTLIRRSPIVCRSR